MWINMCSYIIYTRKSKIFIHVNTKSYKHMHVKIPAVELIYGCDEIFGGETFEEGHLWRRHTTIHGIHSLQEQPYMLDYRYNMLFESTYMRIYWCSNDNKYVQLWIKFSCFTHSIQTNIYTSIYLYTQYFHIKIFKINAYTHIQEPK